MRLARRLSGPLAPAFPLLLLLVLTSTAAAPTITPPKTGRVSGHVRDNQGAPVANAHVFIVGTALTALCDSAGSYLLPEVPEGTHQIRAAFIGYKPSQATIVVQGGRTTIHNFSLVASPTQLEEVTVATDAAAAAAEVSPTQRARGVGKGVGKVESLDQAQARPERPSLNALPVEPWRWQREPGNTEAYEFIQENRFLGARANPLSTFSIDVDAASYSNVRRFLSQGSLPPADAVRLEELV
ncbi:MAG TPA: von Willebrand factor type A domain-containing protein, partial [Gemmatimonadales bacterium]